jgi:hypothetical protein
MGILGDRLCGSCVNAHTVSIYNTSSAYLFASISVSIIASQVRESLRTSKTHRDRAGFDSLAENDDERKLAVLFANQEVRRKTRRSERKTKARRRNRTAAGEGGIDCREGL